MNETALWTAVIAIAITFRAGNVEEPPAPSVPQAIAFVSTPPQAAAFAVERPVAFHFPQGLLLKTASDRDWRATWASITPEKSYQRVGRRPSWWLGQEDENFKGYFSAP